MIKLFFIFIQLAILVIIGSLVIDYSFPVSLDFDEDMKLAKVESKKRRKDNYYYKIEL